MSGIVLLVQEAGIEVLEVGQARAVERLDEALGDQHLHHVVGGHHEVVVGHAGLKLFEDGLVRIVGVDVDLDARPLLEPVDHFLGQVVRPDVDVELSGRRFRRFALLLCASAGERRARPGRSASTFSFGFSCSGRKQPMGEDDQDDRAGQQQRRDRVDLGRDADLEHRIDVERQRRGPHSGDEGRDHVVVDRQGEDEQARSPRCPAPRAAASPAGRSRTGRRPGPAPPLRATDRAPRGAPAPRSPRRRR